MSEVKSDDTVLILNFHDQLAPPKGLSDFEELPCGPAGVLRVHEPEIGQGLRDLSIDAHAWERAKTEIGYKLDELKLRSSGAVHLYFNGPHPLALWLGQQLDTSLRQRQLFIYQFDVRQRDWLLFLDMNQSSTKRSSRILPAATTVGGLHPGGEGHVLSIEVIQHSDPTQLEALRAHVNAREIRRIQSPATGTVIAGGDEALEAMERIVTELNGRRKHDQRAPIYLATSAPAALVIGVGKRLPLSVFSQVWGCLFDADRAQYLPMLEAIRGQVAQAARPRLEIISKEHGILYRLNGKLLEAVGSDMGGDDTIDRRTQDEGRLDVGVKKLAQAILPSEVDEAIRGQAVLDIELSLTGPAAELSWELMSLRRGDQRDLYAALRKDWTLTRLYRPTSGPIRPVSPPVNAGELRVLIVPSLDRNIPDTDEEKAEQYLKLKVLSQRLSDAGVYVRRLDYGVSLVELQTALKEVKPHILHWVGHGMPDDGAGARDVLELTDSPGLRGLDRTRLPEFIRLAGPDLRLLVLSACYAVSPLKGYGVPGLLLESGVGAVIGYRDAVGMMELAWFAESFYPALLRGKSIRDALAEARSAIHREDGYPASFASPILCAASPRAVGPLVKGVAGR